MSCSVRDWTRSRLLTCRKIQGICVGLPPYSVDQSIRPDFISALQIRADFFLRRFRNLLDFFTQTNSDALAAHVITQYFDDLLVDEIDYARAAFNQCHLNIQSGGNAGILNTDHAAPDDGQHMVLRS